MRETEGNRFGILISVASCYNRCSMTGDAGRQERRSVKSTATLAASQNALAPEFRVETDGLFLLHGCMQLGGVVSRLLRQQSWYSQHKTTLLFGLRANPEWFQRVWLGRGGRLQCFSKLLRAFCHPVTGGSPVPPVSAAQCAVLHSKVVLYKAHFNISVWEAVNSISVF